MHDGLGAEVVDRADQQVRLLAAHQIDVAHRPRRVAGQRRRPDQAGRAVAEQVDDLNRGDVVHAQESRYALRARSSCCRTG